jgi:hypothetical protein
LPQISLADNSFKRQRVLGIAFFKGSLTRDLRQNSDPPPPHRPASVYPPAFDAGGGHTRWVERGWGVNILEDARHSSVL